MYLRRVQCVVSPHAATCTMCCRCLIKWQKLSVSLAPGRKTLSLHLSSSVCLQLRGICLINHHQQFVCCVLFGSTKKEAGVCKCVRVSVCKQPTLIRQKKPHWHCCQKPDHIFSHFIYQRLPPINSLEWVGVCVLYVCIYMVCVCVGDRCLLIRQVCTANSA